MRHTALIVAVIGSLLFTAVYGAMTVVFSRLSRGGGLSRRYASESPEPTGLYVHDVFMELPCGVRVTGDGQKTGTLTWGFLKLPVSHRESVGWLLIVQASISCVAFGADEWREKIFGGVAQTSIWMSE